MQAAQKLLLLLLKFLDNGEQPLVFGIDETIERRWGPKIASIAMPCVKPLRQNQRAAVDANVANDSLGSLRLGAAVFDSIGAL